jgi:hypothetical protein
MPKSNKTLEERMLDKMRLADDCWIWTGGTNNIGYGLVRDGAKMRTVHRVAAEMAGKIPQPGQIVCHSCDNKLCFNPAHLWLGTHKENTQDMMHKGRHYTPMLGCTYPKVYCEHCKQMIGPTIYKRRHGDNCSKKTKE